LASPPNADDTNKTDQAKAPPLSEGSPPPAPVALLPVFPGEDPVPASRWLWWLLLLLVMCLWLYLRQREREEVQTVTRGAPAGVNLSNAVADPGTLAHTPGMKKFFTGAAINADLLITMLEKHGIEGRQENARELLRANEDEFSRETIVFVPEADYDRAWQLFYGERGDEL
jgi:hypothetical protein